MEREGHFMGSYSLSQTQSEYDCSPCEDCMTSWHLKHDLVYSHNVRHVDKVSFR